MDDAGHIPVLVDEVLELLKPRAGDCYVDCTVGRGGHAVRIAQSIGNTGRIVAFDQDAGNLAYAQQRLRDESIESHFIHGNFVIAPAELKRMNFQADMMLADLGISSNQLDEADRGFSFGSDAPLDMRMNTQDGSTAADLIARLNETELADVIFQYGEDPYAKRIARKLVQSRAVEPIQSTAQLARLVVEAYGSRAARSRMHPATRTFMALRIAVNEELTALQALLKRIADSARSIAHGMSHEWLQPGARVAIISFHSLEDRLVKRMFAELGREGSAQVLTRRPLNPTPQEVATNPRARSARLRAIVLTQSPGQRSDGR